MHLPTLLDKATASTAVLMEAVTPDRYSDPTPCHDWDLATLAKHLVDGTWMFAHALTGRDLPAASSADLIGPDPAAAYRTAVQALTAATGAAGTMTRMVTLPIGTVPSEVALNLALLDTVVHGWDLATATGQDSTIPDELAAAVLAFATVAIDDTMRGSGRPFGVDAGVPPSAPTGDQLIGFLGRSPRQ